MRFGKVYLEITDVCNLRCSFCHGTKRPPRFMSREEFILCLNRLKGYTKHLYFHVMGEPLLHPLLEEFLTLAREEGFSVDITTNGTLLEKQKKALLSAFGPERVNISLHAFEGSALQGGPELYLASCLAFARESRSVITCFRLWNGGGTDTLNPLILREMHRAFPGEWEPIRKGFRLAPLVYLEISSPFTWPDLSLPENTGDRFCFGLRDQCGVLSDGTVIPCCLDAEGAVALGNLFEQDLDTVLSSPRAMQFYTAFSRREAPEPLCRRCTYAAK